MGFRIRKVPQQKQARDQQIIRLSAAPTSYHQLHVVAEPAAPAAQNNLLQRLKDLAAKGLPQSTMGIDIKSACRQLQLQIRDNQEASLQVQEHILQVQQSLPCPGDGVRAVAIQTTDGSGATLRILSQALNCLASYRIYAHNEQDLDFDPVLLNDLRR